MSESTTTVFDRLQSRQTDTLLVLLENMVWPILILSFVVFGLLIPSLFLSIDNVMFIIYSSASLGVLTLAESICLLSGNFDLSVASIAGFSAMFTGLFLQSWFPGLPGVVGIVVILAVGGLIGLLNGLSIGVLGVNPFLQTLTFLIIFDEATTVLSTLSLSGLPASYLYLGEARIANFPVAVFVLVALFVLMWFFLKYSPQGQAVRAVGGDENAAKEAGINTTRVIVGVYVLSGVLSSLSGLLFSGYLGTVTPTLADGALFPAFAAAVIGGISLFGGRGNVLGALGGVILLSTIQSGLVLMNVPTTWVRLINGLILLAAVLLYTGEEQLRKYLLSV